MLLKEILKDIEYKTVSDISFIEIANITCDSRSVVQSDMFIAVRGYDENGYKYIGEAVKRGAKAILTEEDFNSADGIIKLMVRSSRTAAGAVAANFYGHPSNKMKMIGVTGTNGKTTITYIIENIMKRSGSDAGVIGTVNYRIKDRILPSKNTTPGPIELQSILADMARGGLAYAIMEVSSHALDQHRTDGIGLDVGIFTNISSEHLDYHKTIPAYFRAKTKLFERLKQNGIAVVNNDDDMVSSLKDAMKNGVLTYGIKKDADVKAENISLRLDGSKFTVKIPKGSFEIRTKLIGIHNVSNILAAIAAALAFDIDFNAIRDGIESMAVIPGRLEEVNIGQPFKVFVDYAHTEDALRNILSLLREVAPRNIITLFGCGGNRDRLKRPLMGRVACQFSDRVVITSDNPRFEDPKDIIDEIESGIRTAFSNYEVIVDRRRAIARALALAGRDDVVVLAGKGHETYQIVGKETMPFDDREVALEILKRVDEDKRIGKGDARKVNIG